MLTASGMRPARPIGATLVELLVTLFVAGIMLGLVTSTGVRQQRMYGDVGRRIMGQEQLRHAGAMFPIDLRAASTSAGDIVPGEARDTSLELRATLGSSIVCDAAGTSLALLAPAADADLAAFADAPREGDTLWVLDESGDDERWRPLAVGDASPGARACLTSRADPAAASPVRAVLVAETGGTGVGFAAPGAPVRLTRRVRYSFYRAADGRWYLGYRDWNAAVGSFNGIQPTSGPFLPPAEGVGFRYYDAAGAAVPAARETTAAITRVELALRAAGEATLGAAGARAGSVDTSIVAVALRNRW